MSSLVEQLRHLSSKSPLPGLVWAIRADSNEPCRELASGEAIPAVDDGWLWLHFNFADDRACGLVEGLVSIPRSAITLFKSTEAAPQIQIDGPFTFGVLTALHRDISETTGSVGSLPFLLADRVLITGRRGPLAAAGAIRQRLLSGLKVESAAALLDTLIGQILETVDSFVERLAREVDQIEDRIIAGSAEDARSRLAEYRRTSVRLRRHVSDLRSLLLRIERESKRTIVPPHLMSLAAQLLQESDQLDRDIGALNERVRSLQGEVATLLAEETNRSLRVLSIISILFMPPTFIAGLFGMNLHGMAFAEWPAGFWAATAVSLFSSALVVWGLIRAGILRSPGYH